MIQGVSQRNEEKNLIHHHKKHPFQEPAEDEVYMISFQPKYQKLMRVHICRFWREITI